MFDLAAVAERYGADYIVGALRKCGLERCRAALGTIEKAVPAAVAAINAQLMARETTRHLAGSAQEISRELIERAIAEIGG